MWEVFLVWIEGAEVGELIVVCAFGDFPLSAFVVDDAFFGEEGAGLGDFIRVNVWFVADGDDIESVSAAFLFAALVTEGAAVDDQFVEIAKEVGFASCLVDTHLDVCGGGVELESDISEIGIVDSEFEAPFFCWNELEILSV